MKKWLMMLGVLLVGGLLFILHCLTPFPKVDLVEVSYEDVFYIEADNRFETQIHNECSAFSSAYVLRYFGEDAAGLSLYEEFKYKLPFSGYVLPKGILSYFEESPYEVTMYTGTVESLKMRLNEGVPVIVLVGDGLNWQHYMTLVGYDDSVNEVYFFDSLKQTDENGDVVGNRTLSGEYFEQLWNNKLPIFNRLYFVMKERG